MFLVTILNHVAETVFIFQPYLLIAIRRFGIITGVLYGVISIDSVHPFGTKHKRDVFRLLVGEEDGLLLDESSHDAHVRHDAEHWHSSGWDVLPSSPSYV